MSLDEIKKRLEIDKLKMESEKISEERDKIRVELRELNKPWYYKPAWWSAVGPLLIGIAGVIVAFETNIFGIQELQRKERDLNDSIKQQTNIIALQKTDIKLEKRRLEELDTLIKNAEKKHDQETFNLKDSLSKERLYYLVEKTKNEINLLEDSSLSVDLNLTLIGIQRKTSLLMSSLKSKFPDSAQNKNVLNAPNFLNQNLSDTSKMNKEEKKLVNKRYYYEEQINIKRLKLKSLLTAIKIGGYRKYI